MNKLVEKVKALFAEGAIEQTIGFEKGNRGPRPFFCKHAEDADRLMLDEHCIHNIAVYLTKPELLGTGKVALTANLATLRTLMQLSAEHQLKEDKFIILTLDPQGEVIQFDNLEAINAYLKDHPIVISEENRKLLDEIRSMPREERWKYWVGEMSKCVKCYACRAACPLCYCNRCIVEVNCPQWIPAWSAPLSNMEWQINRVMHMAGRCVSCNACKEACPVGIPIHLMTLSLMEDVRNEFGYTPGDGCGKGNVLSTFKVEDKEGFIR